MVRVAVPPDSTSIIRSTKFGPVRSGALTPLDEDGSRECCRPDCGARFRPRHPASEGHCSDLCAQIGFYRRHNMDPTGLMEQLMGRVQIRVDAAERLAKARAAKATAPPNPERDAISEQRYGPLRDIATTLSRTRTSCRVTFTCGHQGTVPLAAKKGRCRTCRNDALGITPKRGRPPKIPRTPVAPDPPPRSGTLCRRTKKGGKKR